MEQSTQKEIKGGSILRTSRLEVEDIRHELVPSRGRAT